ncbi:MAG: hypothetical protein V1909_01340 [Candidatus Micrarchaeota archaeon]
MKTKIKMRLANLEEKVFDIQNEPMPGGAWWWWFWLFFFNNPKDPKKPRQLMILWSTKNVKEIQCNDLIIRLASQTDRSKLDGAVAAWYFDGEKMHHNFLLEQCIISISGKQLSSDSAVPTSFLVDKNKSDVRIGNDFHFIAESKESESEAPNYNANTYIGNLGYGIIRSNRLDLKGMVGKEQISGTAYFQRVFVNALSPSWYWGLFHFENGGNLSYFRPYLFGKTIKKDITFFDGKKMHEFRDIKTRRLGKELPKFEISGENASEKISFTVETYSHSSWTFKKKTFGLIPNKLVYNEYPAVISKFEFTSNTEEKITLEKLGNSVGNAEHTTGFLL